MNCPYCEFEAANEEEMARHIVDSHFFLVANSELHLSPLAEEIIDMCYNFFLFGDEYLSPTA